MKTIFLHIILILSSLGSVCHGGRKQPPSYKGQCDVCRDFVNGFEGGLKNTESNSFAGGDTSWEEENNKVYSKSEVRLIEVMDGICSGNDYQCSRFLEQYEEDIEKWWMKLKDNGHDDLLKWLCFDHADVCCPEGTYGPDCTDCPGGRDNPCNGHGTCKGEGEKEEVDGRCSCRSGYKGIHCQSCKNGYYMLDDGSTCEKCDKSCKDVCTGPGGGNCTECANGYRREEEGGDCEDIDECSDGTVECKDGTYCHNTAGNYECLSCHKSCKFTCSGRSPRDCHECSEGYRNESGTCTDINECSEELSDCIIGTYCANILGSYKCEQCDEVCNGGCNGSGPSSCDACKDGYTMTDGTCKDVDECDSSPCDTSSELCINEAGGYKCKCAAGYTRVQGRCTQWEEAEKIRGKERKKKKAKTSSSTVIDEGTAETEVKGQPDDVTMTSSDNPPPTPSNYHQEL